MRTKTALRIWPKLWGTNGYLRTAGYIFVVGHMRSYSSLLAHILGTHSQIVGYAEMHQKYRNWLDLLELNSKVERSCDKPCARRHVLDKILHPQQLAPRILGRKDLRMIAIARQPSTTIASIVHTRAGGIDRAEAAVHYYVERMAELVRLAKIRRGELFYLDGESLIERTDETLAKLGDYLQLASPLCSEYSIFRFTGARKYGDPSEWIKSGRIVANRAPLPKVALSSSQTERISAAYEGMCSYMRKHADVSLLKSDHMDVWQGPLKDLHLEATEAARSL